MLVAPYWLGLKAEALHSADRLSEALETIREAQALAEASGERWWLPNSTGCEGCFSPA